MGKRRDRGPRWPSTVELEALSRSQTAEQARETQQRQVLERAVAALQELQLREEGLLDDRLVDPPGHLLQALGEPPADAAARQAWQPRALQLERARGCGGEHQRSRSLCGFQPCATNPVRFGRGPGSCPRVDRRP